MATESSPIDVAFKEKALSIRHFRENVNGKNLIFMIVTDMSESVLSKTMQKERNEMK
jgi:hypothetical protein